MSLCVNHEACPECDHAYRKLLGRAVDKADDLVEAIAMLKKMHDARNYLGPVDQEIVAAFLARVSR